MHFTLQIQKTNYCLKSAHEHHRVLILNMVYINQGSAVSFKLHAVYDESYLLKVGLLQELHCQGFPNV